MVFLGAGLSFGAARLRARATFDNDRWVAKHLKSSKLPPSDPTNRIEIVADDDGLPLPSWPLLISRMRSRLAMAASEDHCEYLARFFRDQGPLDCAQLFRTKIGPANYREFLEEQFDDRRHSFIQTTPSHLALAQLELPRIFTTNFDQLIERTYLEQGTGLVVSRTESQFKAHLKPQHDAHLIKLHGSIDEFDSIVLTREDYSRARSERREMFASLRDDMAEGAFLFIGFSLSDPNFNVLRDDLRQSLGSYIPASYTVQGDKDPVREDYLASLDINTIWLDSWNNLPVFLKRIHPKWKGGD